MSDEHRYVPGKVDYNGSGQRNCQAEVTWTLKYGIFSMYAAIWNPGKTDCYAGGQNVDEVADYFPEDVKLQKMRAIWQRWHLNNGYRYGQGWKMEELPAEVIVEIESWG